MTRDLTRTCPRARRARGFTLIEAALTTVIVGVGIASAFQLFAACSNQNRCSARMSTAMMLATNIQEAMGNLTFSDPGSAYTYFGPESGESLANYDDVDDFDGSRFNPPIDSLRQPVRELSQYTQVVSVWPVYTNKLSVNSNERSPDIPKSGTPPTATAPYTGAVRVRVRILYRASPNNVAAEVYRASWVRVNN